METSVVTVCTSHSIVPRVPKTFLKLTRENLDWGTLDSFSLGKTAREFQKNIYFPFIDYAKDFGCVDHNKLWEIFKEREYQTI